MENLLLNKKNSQDSRNFRTDEELKSHFILRLGERYDIWLTDDDYNDIHHFKGFTHSNIIDGPIIIWAELSTFKKVFIVKIKGKNVLAIYSNRRGRFITALPWESYDDETRFVPRILKKLNLKEEAIERYRKILSICSKEYTDFGNSKENWYFYKKCSYPKLLMAEYKGTLTVGYIYKEVIKELTK